MTTRSVVQPCVRISHQYVVIAGVRHRIAPLHSRAYGFSNEYPTNTRLHQVYNIEQPRYTSVHMNFPPVYGYRMWTAPYIAGTRTRVHLVIWLSGVMHNDTRPGTHENVHPDPNRCVHISRHRVEMYRYYSDHTPP
jgi:hypothetical protein